MYRYGVVSPALRLFINSQVNRLPAWRRATPVPASLKAPPAMHRRWFMAIVRGLVSARIAAASVLTSLGLPDMGIF